MNVKPDEVSFVDMFRCDDGFRAEVYSPASKQVMLGRSFQTQGGCHTYAHLLSQEFGIEIRNNLGHDRPTERPKGSEMPLVRRYAGTRENRR